MSGILGPAAAGSAIDPTGPGPGIAPVSPSRRRVSADGSAARVVAPVVVGLMLLAVWQLASGLKTGRLSLIPAPSAVLQTITERTSYLLDNAVITGTNALIGLLAGTLIGVGLAALAAWARPIDGMLNPLVAAIAVVPIVALTPLLNTMFGASSQFGRQIVAGIAAFVPIFVNSLRGLRQTTPVQRDLFRAYAADGGQQFRKLTLPTAIPYLMTGVRIASSLAVISALVAEYFGGPANGLGTQIASLAKTGNQSLAWACVAAAIAVGLIFFFVTAFAERLATKRSPVR